MPGEARKHHYVPKSYLSRFVDESRPNQLHVLDKDSHRQWVANIQDIACERDFYRIEGATTPEAANELEDFFAKIESKSKPIIDELVLTRTLPEGENWEWLLAFVSALTIRGPAIRETIDAPMRQMWKHMLQQMVSSEEAFDDAISKAQEGNPELDGLTYAAAKKMVEQDQIEAVTSQNFLLQLTFDMFKTISGLLAARAWKVYRTSTTFRPFVCSDRPVTLAWNSRSALTSGYPPGFGLKNTTVCLPLDRHTVLMGAFEAQPTVPDPLPEIGVAATNCLTAGHALRYVYSTEPDFVVTGRDGKSLIGRDEFLAMSKSDRPKSD